jgi:uncharacterized protein (DUF1499 family)
MGPAGEITDMTAFFDFAKLTRPSSPNQWLFAPAQQRGADEQAPVWPVSPQRLAEAWLATLEQAPRTRVLAVSDDRLQIEAEQRSALFRFVDRISFRAVSQDEGHATFFAYSRSQVGYWDMGVNRRRLRHWVDEVRSALNNA